MACEQQYKKRPFAPQQHTAVLENGVYRWGGLDVGGAKGFSALVTFAQDGQSTPGRGLFLQRRFDTTIGLAVRLSHQGFIIVRDFAIHGV